MLEVRRQIFHIALGLVLIALIYFDLLESYHLFALLIVGVVISALTTRQKLPVVGWLLQKFDRAKDKGLPGKGPIFYILGALLVVHYFPKDIAMASIIILALGDSFSRLESIHFGTLKHPNAKEKYVVGWLFGLVAAFLGAMLFVPWHHAFFAAFVAMSVEAMELHYKGHKVDDNITIPVIAGSVLFFLQLLA